MSREEEPVWLHHPDCNNRCVVHLCPNCIHLVYGHHVVYQREHVDHARSVIEELVA